MPRIGFVLYHPRKGKEDELVSMIQTHFPFLRREGFITERKVVGMKAKDGSIMVVFEWMTSDAIDEASTHSGIQKLWTQVSKISDFGKPGTVKELHQVFPDFEALTIE
ncbi:MAG TPA: hypothetical protein VFW11_13930 [Cyclobacteriaceae bacterium]|nr:hypothetical protein [Cyclobacteriaceae bacterium]